LAGSRKPGPLGIDGIVPNIQDGTLIRNVSHPPGPARYSPPHQNERRITYRPLRKSHAGLPILREGIKDKYVRWAQVLLNEHHASTEPLKVDGYFGPKTLASVIDFQRSMSVTADGVIGMQTWVRLQVIETTPEKSTTISKVTITEARPVLRVVQDWSLSRRFEEVLKLTPNHLTPELAAQFRAMLTPLNVGIMVASLVAWAVSHAFGVGEIADIVLGGLGVVFLGMAALQAIEELGECLMTTVHAENYPELDKAADYLAQAVAILGVVAFFALLAKVGAKFGRAASVGEEEAAVASESAARKPPPKAPKSRTLEEPKESTSGPKEPPSSRLVNSEFNGVKAQRVRPGTNNKVAVIGRSMDKAVEPYSKGLQAEGYEVETFSGDRISPAAQAEWKNLKTQYAPDPIPEDVVRNSQLFQENQAWAQKLADQGYTVVDVGNPAGQASSPFYQMEKQTLFGQASAAGAE